MDSARQSCHGNCLFKVSPVPEPGWLSFDPGTGAYLLIDEKSLPVLRIYTTNDSRRLQREYSRSWEYEHGLRTSIHLWDPLRVECFFSRDYRKHSFHG